MEKYLCISIQRQGIKNSIKELTNGKKKIYRGFYSQRLHNRRLEEQDPNYLLNKELQEFNIYKDFKTHKQVRDRLKETRQDYKDFHKRKIHSKRKPFINGLITFSNTILEDLNLYKRKNRELLFEIITNFLKKENGENNLISLDLHMEETTPHFHYSCVNYDNERHITYSSKIERDIKQNEGVNLQQDRLEKYLKDNIEDFEYLRGKKLNKKSYLDQRSKNHQHLKEQEKKLQDFEERINFIVEGLKDLEEEKDLQKFNKLVVRYLNNIPKLDNLLNKWEKSLKNNNPNYNYK